MTAMQPSAGATSRQALVRSRHLSILALLVGLTLLGFMPAVAAAPAGSGRVTDAVVDSSGTAYITIRYRCFLEEPYTVAVSADEQDTQLLQGSATRYGGPTADIQCTGKKETATITLTSDTDTPFAPGPATFTFVRHAHDGIDTYGPTVLSIETTVVLEAA
ncbi:hypothetical protein [Geodermatophilus sp. SYSU D00710]